MMKNLMKMILFLGIANLGLLTILYITGIIVEGSIDFTSWDYLTRKPIGIVYGIMNFILIISVFFAVTEKEI